MSDMTDVILMHSQIGRDDLGQFCKGCGHHYGYAAERTLHRKASAHVGHMLSAAGFGPVQEARAEAWDECLLSDTPWINPYRSA